MELQEMIASKLQANRPLRLELLLQTKLKQLERRLPLQVPSLLAAEVK
jgi:hypothetical protein